MAARDRATANITTSWSPDDPSAWTTELTEPIEPTDNQGVALTKRSDSLAQLWPVRPRPRLLLTEDAGRTRRLLLDNLGVECLAVRADPAIADDFHGSIILFALGLRIEEVV